ncbi:9203_t:CDS:1, partial [Funneliformis geosporum]
MHETGRKDFAINDTKILIINTINNIVNNDDIISIADSVSPDMDILNENDMKFSVDKFHNKLLSSEISSLANSLLRPSNAMKINA